MRDMVYFIFPEGGGALSDVSLHLSDKRKSAPWANWQVVLGLPSFTANISALITSDLKY